MSGRLADAIVVARDFLNRHQSVLNQRMSTHPFLVANAGVHSAGVAVFESLGEGALSIEQAVRRDLASSAKGAYDLTCIDIPAAEASIDSGEEGGTKTPDRIIRSVLLRYPTRARILMVDNLNPCWKRFAMCKEFAHLIMDEEHGNRALSVAQQISDALDIARSPDPSMELSSEAFAWFTAVELMLPITDRTNLMARHGAGEDHMSLARSYWIPRAIIDLFFDTPYITVSNSIR